MANIVEFLIKVVDGGSNPLLKFGNTGESVFGKLSTGLMGVQKQISQTSYQLTQLNKPINLSVNTSGLQVASAQVDMLQNKILMLGAGSGGGGGNILNIDRWQHGGGGRSGGGRNNTPGDDTEGSKGKFNWFGLGGFARQAAMLAGIGGAAYIGKDIMQSGMERQLNQISFETLLGKKSGDTVNDQLVKFAKDSIYGNEVISEGKLLAGSGVKAGNILPIEKMFGDIAGGEKERMKTYALAFSEANSTGHLTGRQNLMFRTALFNPLQQLSEMTHKPMSELEKDMEKGKISIIDLVKAMEHATGPGGRWHNMMQKMQETPTGKWTAFTGAVGTLAGTIGLQLLPVLGKTTDILTGLINDAPLLAGIATGIGVMAGAWALYSVWTERAAIWQGILEVVAFWPVAVIGAIAGGITYLCVKYESWGNSMKAIWEIAKDLTIGMGLMFKDCFSQVGYFFDLILLKLEVGFEKFTGMFANVAKAKDLALGGDFKAASLALVAPIHTEAGTRLDALQGANKISHGANMIAIKGVFDAANNAAKSIHFDTKNPKTIKNPLDILTSAFTPDKAAITDTLGDATKGITGGGVRNITINVGKFTEKVEVNTTNFKEGIGELEDILKDMFLRITNSAATATS